MPSRTLLTHAHHRLAASSFLTALRLWRHPSRPDRSIWDVALPFQRTDFQALPTHSRLYLERPRGHSKTTDAAVYLAWRLMGGRVGSGQWEVGSQNKGDSTPSLPTTNYPQPTRPLRGVGKVGSGQWEVGSQNEDASTPSLPTTNYPQPTRPLRGVGKVGSGQWEVGSQNEDVSTPSLPTTNYPQPTRPLRAFVAAADWDQACLTRDALSALVQANPPLHDSIRVLKQQAVNPRTGGSITFLTSDVSSSWGLLPDLILCDELAHWPDPEFWESLLSSSAKNPHAQLLITTNAGTGQGWQWRLREAARAGLGSRDQGPSGNTLPPSALDPLTLDPSWHFHSLRGPQAPWITAAALDEQRRLLPPQVFRRLWLNEWADDAGDFVTSAEAHACTDSSLTQAKEGLPGREYVAAIDYAEKHDHTVLCIVHQEGEQVIVDRMEVIVPTPDCPTPVQAVRDWIHRTALDFPSVRFVLDEYQLLELIQTLQHDYPIERFPFAGTLVNDRLARTLRRLILEQRLHWPEGTGALPTDPTDTLSTELASLRCQELPNGRLRITHISDGQHHDDRSFALGAACTTLLTHQHDTPTWQLTPPIDDDLFRM